MRSAGTAREIIDFDVELERRSRKYWINDGSVILWVNGTKYRVHRSLISRLSPQFFSECCHRSPYDDRYNAQEAFEIESERNLGKDYFETLLAHLYHDIALDDNEVSFDHLLRLYLVTGPKYLQFATVHSLASKRLQMLCDRPLDIDFSQWNLIKTAHELSDENTLLKAYLKKVLYYAYTVSPEISFGEEPQADETTGQNQGEEEEKDRAETTSDTYQLSTSEIEACSHLMAQISDYFSSILYQPPAALHMECTDVYASLWMEQAVQPSFSDGGMGHPFMTLNRLRNLDWKRDPAEIPEGARDQPCDECLAQRKDDWKEEAEGIWRKMDEWMK